MSRDETCPHGYVGMMCSTGCQCECHDTEAKKLTKEIRSLKEQLKQYGEEYDIKYEAFMLRNENKKLTEQLRIAVEALDKYKMYPISNGDCGVCFPFNEALEKIESLEEFTLTAHNTFHEKPFGNISVKPAQDSDKEDSDEEGK